ncbi:hypothetical protein JHK86_039619 [Glycine max]|nr:hypothetical protein JHK86_039619 [Glycine max]
MEVRECGVARKGGTRGVCDVPPNSPDHVILVSAPTVAAKGDASTTQRSLLKVFDGFSTSPLRPPTLKLATEWSLAGF